MRWRKNFILDKFLIYNWLHVNNSFGGNEIEFLATIKFVVVVEQITLISWNATK